MRTPLALILAAGLGTAGSALAQPAPAEEAVFVMHKVDAQGVGERIGEIKALDTPDGLVLQPNLHGLPPGAHGFHVHENADCRPEKKDGQSVAAGMAGNHYDPQNTGKHLGPSGSGHKGDLPVLRVDSDGVADEPLTVPRLTVKEIRDRALVIHAGGDNYSDEHQPLGGGGARIACGVLEKTQT
jgi:Cu-Zn family superoxide dismutase